MIMKIFVGTSGFAHKEWVGPFYPGKIKAGEMLRYYGERLASVEINNTFYHMPKESVLTTWAEQVPQGFVFAVKAPQRITHIKRLRNVGDDIAYLFRSLATLGSKEGPVLFQFPATFRPHPELLQEALAMLPPGARCAFEFRNPGWLEQGVLEQLHAKGCSLCIADTDEVPVASIVSTAGWGYLRLRRDNYTDADLAAWAERILDQPWDRAFVFFKHEGEEGGAEVAMRFRRMVDASERKRRTEGIKEAV
jgi:uncharacterized protein YecE (DUF72 family)